MHRALRVLQWRQSAVKRTLRISIEGDSRTFEVCRPRGGQARSGAAAAPASTPPSRFNSVPVI